MKLLIPSLASVALFSPASAANFMIVSQLGLSDPYVAALTAEFPGSTFSTGIFSDHTAPATLAAVAAADLIIFSRDSNSGSYNQAGEVAFYNDLTIPIIQSNFLILRDNRWGWTDSDATTSATPNGSETTVTPSGAAFLGIAPGPQDFFEDGGNYGSTPATLDFGDGVILANATVGGSVTVAGWSAGDMVANGDVLGGDRLYLAASNNVDFTPDGQAALGAIVDNLITVPEPSSALLAFLSLGLLARRSR